MVPLRETFITVAIFVAPFIGSSYNERRRTLYEFLGVGEGLF